MPPHQQDPHLYGQRPAKKQKKEIPLSSSLAFTSQLSSLISTTSSTEPGSSTASATAGRSRPSRTKDDIFAVKAKRKHPRREDDDAAAPQGDGKSKIRLRDPHGTDDDRHEHARTRRRMEDKARLYAAMKRGDHIAPDTDGRPGASDRAPLVDFDRKWAERHPGDEDGGGGDSSSGADNASSDDDNYNVPDLDTQNELVDYTDEYGRTRRVPRHEATRLERRTARRALGQAELEGMAARPAQPAPFRLIHGDAIQHEAFGPQSTRAEEAMEALAARRDKEPTPPPDSHFDARREIRHKGVGFYQFATDSAADRADQMDNLAAMRAETERTRAARDEARDRRRRDIEARRARLGNARASKRAESFLDGLAGEMGGAEATDGHGSDSRAAKNISVSEQDARKDKVAAVANPDETPK